MTADVSDLEDIAQLFGVTEKAVRGWIAIGMPIEKRGKRGRGGEKTQISLRAAVEWYFAENFERLELDRQRTRLAEEQADKLALENAERRGELVEISVWQLELESFLSELRAALLALPVKWAQRLDGDVNQRKDRLESAVHEFLKTVAAYKPGKASSGGEAAAGSIADDSAAPAAVNGQSVGRQQAATERRKQRRARPMDH